MREKKKALSKLKKYDKLFILMVTCTVIFSLHHVYTFINLSKCIFSSTDSHNIDNTYFYTHYWFKKMKIIPWIIYYLQIYFKSKCIFFYCKYFFFFKLHVLNYQHFKTKQLLQEISRN